MRVSLLAVLWVLLVALPLGCSGKTQAQRMRAKVIAPAELYSKVPPGFQPRKLLARLYADDAYRSQNLGWTVEFYRQMERANGVLRAQLGVEIEIERAAEWPRDNALDSLEVALSDLERLDPGEGVDFVIGLTTALPAVTESIHKLGSARLLGKHIALRGMDSIEEVAVLARTFDRLRLEEREKLYRDRVQHKGTVTLLHEIGHALGALHIQEDRALMSPTHSRFASNFTPPNLKIMEVALEARGDGRRDPETFQRMREKLAARLEGMGFEGFIGAERAQLLTLLTGDARFLARTSDELFGRQLDPDIAAASTKLGPKDPLDEATRLTAEGNLEAAWRLLEKEATAKLDYPVIQSAACSAAARHDPKLQAAEERCEHAAKISANEAEPVLFLAYIRSKRKEVDRALTSLADAETRLARTDEGATSGWAFAAELYREVQAVTAAARAAKLAGDDPRAASVLDWVAQVRKTYRLPEKTGLKPLEEATYMELRNEVQLDLSKRRFKQAEKRARALGRRFPKLPSGDLELCQNLANARRYAEARRACRRVEKAEPNVAKPQAILGFISFSEGRISTSIRHLERAIKLDPSTPDIWSLLHAAYLATGRAKAAARLSARHRKRFGRPL